MESELPIPTTFMAEVTCSEPHAHMPEVERVEPQRTKLRRDKLEAICCESNTDEPILDSRPKERSDNDVLMHTVSSTDTEPAQTFTCLLAYPYTEAVEPKRATERRETLLASVMKEKQLRSAPTEVKVRMDRQEPQCDCDMTDIPQSPLKATLP
jgi:hypothetical protein